MELRLAQLEHNNRGKKTEMRTKQCVFDSRNGRMIMKYYQQFLSFVFLFVFFNGILAHIITSWLLMQTEKRG